MNRPPFLMANINAPLRKYMFIRKGGRAYHKLGNVSRDCYDTELICVSDETPTDWIGNYAEGLGLFEVRFSKKDCREATEEEIEQWLHDRTSVKFDNAKIVLSELLNDLQTEYDEKKSMFESTKDLSFYFYYQGLRYAIQKIQNKLKEV